MDALDDVLSVFASLNTAGVECTVRPIDHADASALRAAFHLNDSEDD